jgi:hypothetical protein
LGPPSLPLARMVCQARSASRFSDTRVERGVASNAAFYLPFFDATAEYHRSDESSNSCAVPGLARCMRGAEHRASTGGSCASGYQGFTRGWDLKYEPSHAGKPARKGPRGRIARYYCSRDGTVLGLGPFVTQHLSVRGDGRASSIELRHLAGKPAGWRVLRGSRRRSHGATGPEPSGAFCYGCLTGLLPQAAEDGKGDRSQRWPEGCLARVISPR